MSLDERQKTFIGYLLSLAKEGKEDRGALADLRSGLGKEPGGMARVHKHVVPFLPEARWDDRWYYVTATLFGLHPKHKNPVKHEKNGKEWWETWTFGRAFRPLAFPPKEPKKDSMEARFVALLNAHPDDLDDHLRHAVSLLKANEQPLDWFQLFQDLLQWDHPDGYIQLRWARDFYKTDSNSTAKEEDQKHE
jgi:CRISPR system Cascade subunit CasB